MHLGEKKEKEVEAQASSVVCSAVHAFKPMLLMIKRRNLNYHPGNPIFIYVIHAEETGAYTAANEGYNSIVLTRRTFHTSARYDT